MRFNEGYRRALPVVAAVAMTLGVAGCSGVSDAPKPTKLTTVELTADQLATINDNAKSGRVGMSGYDEAFVPGSDMSFTFTGDHNKVDAKAPIKLGESVMSEVTIEGEHSSDKTVNTYRLTPSKSDSAASISFELGNESEDGSQGDNTVVTLQNPDSNFFKDGYASSREITRFFKDSSTVMQRYRFDEHDTEHGKCDADVKFSGSSANFSYTGGVCKITDEPVLPGSLSHDLVQLIN